MIVAAKSGVEFALGQSTRGTHLEIRERRGW